jgi:D-alanyl-D-alanine carboxypeptidase (penicillin-binding protein 5/6)
MLFLKIRWSQWQLGLARWPLRWQLRNLFIWLRVKYTPVREYPFTDLPALDDAQKWRLQAYCQLRGPLPPPDHSTTARDLATLATRLMADFPEYLGYYAIKKYRYAGTPAANDNNRNLLLLRDPSVDGLKTGYTEAAGYCMVATAKRDYPGLAAAGATGGSRRLLSIVLGTANENARANESQKLLNWGYTAFEPVKLFDAGQAVLTAKVWKGDAGVVKAGRTAAVVVALPAGSSAKLTTEIVRTEPLLAPIAKGQTVATLRVLVAGAVFTEVPLQALEGVAQAGVLGRAWDALRLWIR